jgi:glycosyltransferase involved in cell wall biosynthesis
MRVLVSHPGTQHSFRLAAQLHRREALLGFYTGLAFAAGGVADGIWRLLPTKLRRRLSNRRMIGVPPSRLHRRPASELAALWRVRRGGNGQEVWHRRAEMFQRSIPDSALSASSAVIGFDTAAWILSARCGALNVPLILDQSTTHPDAKLPAYALAQQQYPDWSEGIEPRRREVREAEQQEHEGAARIVAATTFTKRSLIDHGVAARKIRINPYGVDFERFTVRPHGNSRPLRFIFVGSVNARKGVPLLVDAWQKLGPRGAELWLVGAASKEALALLPELPGLKCWGAVPHEEVAALMQQCDVLVFPSYFEGFGLVLLEAMACGLPVITTTATAGPDIVTQATDGWIIEPGDLAGLIETMNYCLEHPQVVREMGLAARATAERFTWSAYGDRWMEILAEVCGS